MNFLTSLNISVLKRLYISPPRRPTKVILLFLVLAWSNLLIAQTRGCKDKFATNYNASATHNDGSCVYTSLKYRPPIKADRISDTLRESSGLLWMDSCVWTFNDGGGEATIYRIDTTTGNILQTVSLAGAANVDWEDIATDGTCIYVGDFGNNATGARTDLKIYKFPISLILDYKTTSASIIPADKIELINFSYSDQLQPMETSTNNTKFDCEAMLVYKDSIHLFTKNWTDNSTTHYVINSTKAGTYVALPVETLATGFLVTAAAQSPDQKVVVLLGYQASGFGNHFLQLLTGFSGGKYFNGNKRKISLPSAAVMGQAEGITFRNNAYGYISNENFERRVAAFTIKVNQKLHSFNISNLITAVNQ